MSFNDLKIKQNHKDPQGFPQANIKPGPKLQGHKVETQLLVQLLLASGLNELL